MCCDYKSSPARNVDLWLYSGGSAAKSTLDLAHNHLQRCAMAESGVL